MLDQFKNISDYYGCFSGNGWLQELHPDSWDHPARVAFGLSERIYQEGLEKGWLKQGVTVLVTQEVLDEIKAELDKDGTPYR